jgi:hypothetical protein
LYLPHLGLFLQSFEFYNLKVCTFLIISVFNAADSADDSNDSDDEFQICQICSGEDERKKLLHCSECDKLFHPDCVVPPVIDLPSEAWICFSCKEKTEEYIQARRLYIAELQKRSIH